MFDWDKEKDAANLKNTELVSRKQKRFLTGRFCHGATIVGTTAKSAM
jgi:hypothetical protein